MESAAGKMVWYYNLFFICLVLSLVSFALAAVLFFRLDIRNVLGYLTGRRAKRKIKELEASMNICSSGSEVQGSMAFSETFTEKLSDVRRKDRKNEEGDENKS